MDKDFELCISNNRPVGIVMKESPFSQYVTLETDVINEFRGRECVKYNLKLPSEVEYFGQQKVWFVVTELDDPNQQGAIAVKTSMKHALIVTVPFPGKYLAGDMKAFDAEEGENVEINIMADSRGRDTVEGFDAEISILDVLNNSLERFPIYYAEDILPGSSGILSANWSTTGYRKGTYKAVADITYEERAFSVEDVFHIGGLFVEVLDHTRNITNGSIKPVEVTVQSQWSDPIGEVYLDIEIDGKKSKTSNLAVKPWNPTKFVGFIDATNFALGKKDMKITVHYSGELTEYNSTITVVPKPPEQETLNIPWIPILIVLIILIIAANIVWFTIYLVRHRSHDHSKQKKLTELGFSEEEKHEDNNKQ